MNYRRKMYCITAFLFIIIGCLIGGKSVNAAVNCGNVTYDYNASIKNACNMVNAGHGQWGAIWVSSYSQGSNLKAEIVSDVGSGRIPIYLHGISVCPRSGGSCRNPHYAWYIKVLHNSRYDNFNLYKNVEWPSGRGGYYNNAQWDVITPALSGTTTLARNAYRMGSNFTNSGTRTMYLDIDKLKAKSGLRKKVDNAAKTVYDLTLFVYRCAKLGNNYNKPGEGAGGHGQATHVDITIPKRYTFTAYAAADYRASDGKVRYLTSSGALTGWKSSPPEDAKKVSTTTEYGKSASVTLPASLGNYVWDKWGSSCKSGEQNNSARKCTRNPLKSNGGVNGYYKLKSQTLTAYAVTDYRSSDGAHKFLKTNGTVTGWTKTVPDDVYKKTSTVSYGSSASVVMDASKGNYVWKEWGSSCASGERNNSTRTCTRRPLTSNGIVYAYYKLKPVTLTAYAVTEYRQSDGAHRFLTTSNTETGWLATAPTDAYKVERTVTYGESASVTVAATLGNNVWSNWGGSCNANERNGRTCTRNPLNGNNIVYAYYKKGEPFLGRSLITGTNYNTGYVKVSADAGKYFISNCNPIVGCNATFEHWLKRESGSSSTTYTVNRVSNYDKKGVTTTTLDNNKTFNTNEQKVRTDSVTMYPGQVVCETLTFDNNGSMAGGANIKTKVCAAALGDGQPPDPENPPEGTPNVGNSAFLSMAVKNNNVPNYNRYLTTVYAKPGDKLTYRAVYNPVLQYTYYLIPERMRIDGGTIYPASGTNGLYLFQLFNNNKNNDINKGKGLYNWNNAFGVNSANFVSGSFSQNYNHNPGDTTLRAPTNDHTVLYNEVGRSLNETAETNQANITKTTPSQVRFTNNGGFDLGNVLTTAKTSTAYARIPYNFINSTKIISDTAEKVLYAGEKGSIDFSVTTSAKRNNITNGTYATIVRDAKYKLQLSYNENGNGARRTVETAAVTGKMLNPGGLTNGTTETFTQMKGNAIFFNVPDLPAGSRICVRSMVWPINSGGDDNISTSGYPRESDASSWAVSGEQCFSIAKKPSIALLGGNTFIAGKVSTAVSNKNNLAGYPSAAYNINTSTTAKNYIFGSWSELGLIAGGPVSGLASGASTGVGSNNNGNLWPILSYVGGGNKTANYNGNGNNNGNTSTPGGKNNNNSFCARSILTIANNNCDGGTVGDIGSSNSFTNANNDKKNIIERLEVNNSDKETKHRVNNGFSINDETKKTGNGSFYYYSPEDLTFNGGTVNQDTVQMIHTGKNLTIAGDIYLGGGRYKTLNQIPRLIIYAEQNIFINCNVERIDALIIANKKVTTCNGTKDASGKYDINKKEYSTQLTINGAIIAGRLEANRTYGASTGNNSIIPAEIINFDPSLYLWSDSSEVGTGATDADSNLETTHITEVAPRY